MPEGWLPQKRRAPDPLTPVFLRIGQRTACSRVNAKGLLLDRLHVTVSAHAQRVAQGDMVEATRGVVAVDGNTKRNRLAFTRVLAGERDRVGIARLAAFGLRTQGAAIHLAIGRHGAIGHLGALGALPLHQLIRTCLGVLGLLVIGTGHGPGIVVAGSPATGLIGQLHLGIREHHGRLDFVVLVALVSSTARCLEGQTDVQVARVVCGLHGHRVVHGLGRALGLHVLTGQTLEVEVQCALLFMAANAGFALLEAGRAAVVRLLANPLHGRNAGVEHMDVALGNLGPVRCSKSCLRSHSQQRTQKHHGKGGFFHRLLLVGVLSTGGRPKRAGTPYKLTDLRLHLPSCPGAWYAQSPCGNRYRFAFRPERSCASWHRAFSASQYPSPQSCGSCGTRANRPPSCVPTPAQPRPDVWPRTFPWYRWYRSIYPIPLDWPGSCGSSCGSSPWAHDSLSKRHGHPCGCCSEWSFCIPDRRCRASRGTRYRNPSCWWLPWRC